MCNSASFEPGEREPSESRESTNVARQDGLADVFLYKPCSDQPHIRVQADNRGLVPRSGDGQPTSDGKFREAQLTHNLLGLL